LEVKKTDDSASHSRIYNALNFKPLWAESEEDKKKREKVVVIPGSTSLGAIIAGPMIGEEDLSNADDQLEKLRQQAMDTMGQYDQAMAEAQAGVSAPKAALAIDASNPFGAVPAAKAATANNSNPFGAPATASANPFATAAPAFNPFAAPVQEEEEEEEEEEEQKGPVDVSTIDFDEQFMEKLNRRRREREEEEARRVEELRKKHEAERQAKEAALAAERAKFAELAQREKQLEEEKKAKNLEETMARSDTFQFNFKFG